MGITYFLVILAMVYILFSSSLSYNYFNVYLDFSDFFSSFLTSSAGGYSSD